MELNDYRKWIDSIVADKKQNVCGQLRKLSAKEKREVLRSIALQISCAPWNTFAQEEARELSRKAYQLSSEQK